MRWCAPGTVDEKKKALDALRARGVELVEGDINDPADRLGAAIDGAQSVISAIRGGPDLIVDGQVNLLKAAEQAGAVQGRDLTLALETCARQTGRGFLVPMDGCTRPAPPSVRRGQRDCPSIPGVPRPARLAASDRPAADPHRRPVRLCSPPRPHDPHQVPEPADGQAVNTGIRSTQPVLITYSTAKHRRQPTTVTEKTEAVFNGSWFLPCPRTAVP